MCAFLQVESAQARGLCFELCYGHALQSSTSRRYFFAAAHHLGPLVSGKAILLSSGASDAMHTRGPHDVANLAEVLGLNHRADGSSCVALVPCQVVAAAKGRRQGSVSPRAGGSADAEPEPPRVKKPVFPEPKAQALGALPGFGPKTKKQRTTGGGGVLL
jgi:hypothetical protein